MSGKIQGSCLCRGVAWEVVGPLDMMTHCHCSMCRKHHGAAFVTFASASADGFRWHSGEDLIQGYESSPGNLRPFCSRCGSKVPGEPRGDRFFTTAGNLDGDPGGRPAAHIYVSSKAPWHEIHDDVPQFDTMPPGFDAPDLPRRPFDPPTREGALRGSCLCGEVVYEVAGEVGGIIKCHCSRCRKARSAAHGANLFVTNAEFEWISGRRRVERFKVPDARVFGNTFCTSCGSILPRGDEGQGALGIPAGSLDTDAAPGISERMHIFVGSKVPWYEIADDLPQFDEAPVRPGQG